MALVADGDHVLGHVEGPPWRIAQVMRLGRRPAMAAAITGLSVTTAWRRYWWYSDWQLPRSYGKPLTTIPPQRGTKAHPGGGRPWIRSIDEGRYPKPE